MNQPVHVLFPSYVIREKCFPRLVFVTSTSSSRFGLSWTELVPVSPTWALWCLQPRSKRWWNQQSGGWFCCLLYLSSQCPPPCEQTRNGPLHILTLSIILSSVTFCVFCTQRAVLSPSLPWRVRFCPKPRWWWKCLPPPCEGPNVKHTAQQKSGSADPDAFQPSGSSPSSLKLLHCGWWTAEANTCRCGSGRQGSTSRESTQPPPFRTSASVCGFCWLCWSRTVTSPSSTQLRCFVECIDGNKMTSRLMSTRTLH